MAYAPASADVKARRAAPAQHTLLLFIALAAATVLLAFANGRHLLPLLTWIAPGLMLAALRSLQMRWAVTGALAASLAIGAVQWTGVVPLPGPLGAVAAAGLGLVLALPYLADRWLSPRMPWAAALLVFPCAQVSLEWLLFVVSPFGTFGALAYTQASLPVVLQIASLAGLWAVSFVIALAAPAIAALIQRRPDVRPTAVFVVIAVATLTFGQLRLAGTPNEDDAVQVAAIAAKPSDLQSVYATKAGCESDSCEAARLDARRIEADMLRRTAAEGERGAELIVWSEVGVPVFIDDLADLTERMQALTREHELHLAAALWVIEPGERLWRNEVLLLTPDGQVAHTYLKSRPVPGDLDVIGSGVLPVIDTPIGRLAMGICYDLDFPDVARTASGADVLLAPASDWAEITPLHAQMVTLRAVENGYAVVRPSRQGLSVAIDPYGRVLHSDDWFTSAEPTVRADVPIAGVTTQYSRIGDVLPYATLAGILVLTAMAFVGRRARETRRARHAGP